VTRFDHDPDALAWARSRVESVTAVMRQHARHAQLSSRPGDAAWWVAVADLLTVELVGDPGCPIVAAFDPRRATGERDAR